MDAGPGPPCRCLSVQAEVQRPAVSLRQCRTHEKTAFVGVSVERRVEMVNASLIPTQFTWSSQVRKRGREGERERGREGGREGRRDRQTGIRHTYTET